MCYDSNEVMVNISKVEESGECLEGMTASK